MRESKIEAAIVAEAESLGLVAWKLTVPGQRGVPDRMFLRRGGEVAFLEIKAPGRVPTPLQLHTIKRLRERGFYADWADSEAAGSEFFRRWLGLLV